MGFNVAKWRLKIIQKPTSLAINMRSVDTHQPKSTIFAHLLGLQSCLLPTKERNKYVTIPKTFLSTREGETQSKIRAHNESICSLLRWFKMITRLGKWREGRRPVGNHVGEWRAAPTERKYLATTPNSPISIHKLRYFRPTSSAKQPPPSYPKKGGQGLRQGQPLGLMCCVTGTNTLTRI